MAMGLETHGSEGLLLMYIWIAGCCGSSRDREKKILTICPNMRRLYSYHFNTSLDKTDLGIAVALLKERKDQHEHDHHKDLDS